jgi:hypothetical protein
MIVARHAGYATSQRYLVAAADNLVRIARLDPTAAVA